MKVLFHVDENSRWKMTLGNIANMLEYGGKASIHFEIEVLANGPAVQELRPETARHAGLISQMELLAPSVRFRACSNALKAHGIRPEELLRFVQTVPAGVVEIAVREEEGYSYIKP